MSFSVMAFLDRRKDNENRRYTNNDQFPLYARSAWAFMWIKEVWGLFSFHEKYNQIKI